MNKFKSFIKDVLEVVIPALIICFLCFTFIFISSEVHGSSMYPTLKENDRGLSFIIKKNLGIYRFDICVIDTDKNNDLLVKRIIGLPGETIEYKNNVLYVNGVAYREEFLGDVKTNDFKVTLKDDEYYCLGDNREISKDSRFYGPFSKDEIKSTGYFVFYPFDRIGVK